MLVYCHAGCHTSDVLSALGLDWSALFAESLSESERPIAEYEYRDIEGRLSYVVERYPGKKFLQRRPLPGGGWEYNLDGTQKLLYRLPQVTRAISENRWIFLVEGEKDVHTLEAHGLVATTSSGGANGWRSELANYLTGARVAIVPDNDDPGRKFAEYAASSLAGHAATVRMVELPGVPPKADVSVYLNGFGGTVGELKELVTHAPNYGFGHVRTLDDQPSREISWLWKGRIPKGKLTIIGGVQGTGKSYLTLAIASCLSRGYGLPGITSPEETLLITYEDDPGDTIKPRAQALGGDLSKLHVWDARVEPFTLPDDVERLKDILRVRPQITTIVIDPLMSTLGEGDAYRESDVRQRLGSILGLGCTVVGIMHLTKGDREAPVHRFSGSSAFTALARSVMLVEDNTVRVIKSNVAATSEVSRYLIDGDGFRFC